MGLPKTAPTSDVQFQVICRHDPAILPIDFDFDAVLHKAGVYEEPSMPDDLKSDASQDAYIKALRKWEQSKVAALVTCFMDSLDAQTLNVDRKDLSDLAGEAQARGVLLGLMDEARWYRYCEFGDETQLHPFKENEDPVRFLVHQLTEPQKVRNTGKVEAGPRAGATAYQHTYELAASLLADCLVDVDGWPDTWPDKVHVKDGHLAPESIAHLPHSWVLAVSTYMLANAQLRVAEKKA